MNYYSESLEAIGIYKYDPFKEIKLVIQLIPLEQQNKIMITINDMTRYNQLINAEIKQNFKSKVIQSFSHEQRKPLNGAQLYLESALNDKNILQKIQDSYLIPAINALKILTYLINDTVDFQTISENIFDLKLTNFNLQKCFDEIVKLFNPMFNTKKIHFITDIDPTLPQNIKNDEQRLCQILVNLLSNALKFTNSGQVMLKIKNEANQYISFKIIDSGIGIEKDELIKINRVLESKNQIIEKLDDWNGFGLIICQMILCQLGTNKTTLQINSYGKQQGTTVRFIILPSKLSNLYKIWMNLNQENILLRIKGVYFFKKLDYLDTIITQNLMMKLILYNKMKIKILIKQILENNVKVSQIIKIKNTMTTLNFKIQQKCFCNRILSVDDEVFNQDSLQIMLQQLNFNMTIAYNGQEAIDIFLDRKEKKCNENCQIFRLILMDYQMPLLDGCATTKILKQMMEQEQIPNIPIFGVTAFTSKQDIDKCKEAGMDQIIHKLISIRRLKELLINED